MYFAAIALLTFTAVQAIPLSDAAPPTDEATNYNEAAPAVADNSSVSSSKQIFTGGFGTVFWQRGNAGACGAVHAETDFVAALDYRRYGDLGQVSPECGKKIQVTNTKNGKSVKVTIADACPTCLNSNCIDLSVAAFDSIAIYDDGIVPIEWFYL